MNYEYGVRHKDGYMILEGRTKEQVERWLHNVGYPDDYLMVTRSISDWREVH